MKIAVCFSGQIRTGIQNHPNIKEFFGKLYNECDFFIHTSRFETQCLSAIECGFMNRPIIIKNIELIKTNLIE